MAITIEDQQTRLSRRALTAVRELRRLKADADELSVKIKKQEEILKGELGESIDLGGKVVGVDGRGHPLVSLKSTVVRSLNRAMLVKRDPDLVEECTTESERTSIKLLGETA